MDDGGLFGRIVRFTLERRLVVALLTLVVIGAGISVAPFPWSTGPLPRHPVPVDAIPDLGENQQIVFTTWSGRSPQDVEDQITYPLTVSLLGLGGVRTVRSFSYFGFSSIYVLFEERMDVGASRSRLLEKLASLPAGTLPEGVVPTLGPEATALGQVFWYTLEGRDPDGEPAGGWDLDELRGLQDWYVRYALTASDGVAEVASVGGYVREYQIDVDPDAMRAHGVTLEQVLQAVRRSNLDVGARTIEMNRVEYVVRGRGFVERLEDLERAVVKVVDHVPITIAEVARVALGPATRRGALDEDGAEAVGGVVTARLGANPLATIDAVKRTIEEIAPGLPARPVVDWTAVDPGTVADFAAARGFDAFESDVPELAADAWLEWLRASPRSGWPDWITTSQVTIVPFYDRTGLILETLDTLEEALTLEIAITIAVVVAMLWHLGSALLISALLPIAVLGTFLAMKGFGVDANVVALSGIAIAIGTMVDMGIVLVENIVRHLDEAEPDEPRIRVVHRATVEVGPAVLTAVATTVVSFLPVFAMTGAEGKLFTPLAFTKTFALVASIVVALAVLPPAALTLLRRRRAGSRTADREGLVARGYRGLLGLALDHRGVTLAVPLLLVLAGGYAWSRLGEEFMPPLDEGSFLFMPTTMPHASIGEALDVLAELDRSIAAIPEVERAVGKIGRADTALDPAPVSMIETVVHLKPEHGLDEEGRRVRLWRDHIRDTDDIWAEIVDATRLPGVTSAPRLMPIAARLVMLQSGMRAPMGIKVRGPDLETLEEVGLELERWLREVPGVAPESVFADRIVGKPYLEIRIDRDEIARYGLTVEDVQRVIEVAIGGMRVTTTVEGRERYGVRVRYLRELRDSIETIGSVLVASPTGAQIPLELIAEIDYVRGPQVIKSEDTFLTGYVLFDKLPGRAEVEVVEAARDFLEARRASGELGLPAGVSYAFAGSYEHQVRSQRTLAVVLPVALLTIFVILYLGLGSVAVTAIVFSGVAIAWAGGFLLVWAYGFPGFLDLPLVGDALREALGVRPVNLSVAVWVGFLALFGIATDNGVVLAAYLSQRFDAQPPRTAGEVRAATLEAAVRRARPCLMTSATTILALLPVLGSTGRGSDIMVPMAIPVFGGMLVVLVTMLAVPVMYAWLAEHRLRSD